MALFIFGAPAVGKTTLVRDFISVLGPQGLVSHLLDDQLVRSRPLHAHVERLADEDINCAVSNLIAAVRNELSPVISELAHHDYESLFQSGLLTNDDRFIFLLAEVADLLRRSCAREQDVPDEYLIRCDDATRKFLDSRPNVHHEIYAHPVSAAQLLRNSGMIKQWLVANSLVFPTEFE